MVWLTLFPFSAMQMKREPPFRTNFRMASHSALEKFSVGHPSTRMETPVSTAEVRLSSLEESFSGL